MHSSALFELEIENEILSLLIDRCVFYVQLKLIIKYARKLNSRFSAKNLHITHTPRGAVDNTTCERNSTLRSNLFCCCCCCQFKMFSLILTHFRGSLPLPLVLALTLTLTLNCSRIHYPLIMFGGLCQGALIDNINTHAPVHKTQAHQATKWLCQRLWLWPSRWQPGSLIRARFSS